MSLYERALKRMEAQADRTREQLHEAIIEAHKAGEDLDLLVNSSGYTRHASGRSSGRRSGRGSSDREPTRQHHPRRVRARARATTRGR
jgi:hypothetical protein